MAASFTRGAFAVACLCIGNVWAADVPLTFKGLAWGSSPEQFKRHLPGIPEWTCTAEALSGSSSCWAEGGTYAGVKLDRTEGYFSNGKLVSVMLRSSEANSRDRLVQTLMAKHGVPSETKAKVAGKADNNFTRWILEGDQFVAVACKGSDLCTVSIGLGPLTAGPSAEAVQRAKDL